MASVPTDDIQYLEALVDELQRNLWSLEEPIVVYDVAREVEYGKH